MIKAPVYMIVILMLFMGCFYGLFQIKFRVHGLHKDIKELERQLLEEQAELHTLKAEWAYLNNYERLKSLASRHLNLQSINNKQIRFMDKEKIMDIISVADSNQKSEIIYENTKSVKWNYKDKIFRLDAPNKYFTSN